MDKAWETKVRFDLGWLWNDKCLLHKLVMVIYNTLDVPCSVLCSAFIFYVMARYLFHFPTLFSFFLSLYWTRYRLKRNVLFFSNVN